MTGRAIIARRLMSAASVLPVEAQRAFRAFVASLPGAASKPSPKHSWRRAAPKKTVRRRRARQMEFDI
jgi:hypothetical protein